MERESTIRKRIAQIRQRQPVTKLQHTNKRKLLNSAIRLLAARIHYDRTGQRLGGFHFTLAEAERITGESGLL